ncbi:hypothetical protein EDC04DRAFT_1656683 [Pisolithus marmoratus]|nr:hypothetical protein EDC04DRAFT_1656683 [Pisolithus marmoratus]
MNAIVSPKLLRFDYSDQYHDEDYVSFGTGSQFSHVQKVTLSFRCLAGDADAICEGFCGARHVALSEYGLDAFFMPNNWGSDSESVPADRWTSLEALTIYGVHFVGRDRGYEYLIRWLTELQELGRPRLSVRLSGGSNGLAVRVELHNLCNILETSCNLEVDNIVYSHSKRHAFGLLHSEQVFHEDGLYLLKV